MSFTSYHNSDIHEDIHSQAEHNIIQSILAMDHATLIGYLKTINDRHTVSPTFAGSRHERMIRQAIIFREQQIKHGVTQQTVQSESLAGYLLGAAASIAVGAFVGNQVASVLRVGADMDQVNKLLGKDNA